MKPQTYSSHRRYPLQRYLMPVVLFIAFFFAVLEFRQPGILGRSWGLVSILICIGSILQWFYSRVMVNKVQDRAIRAEENFRHFILTGKPFPAGLTLRQIISLRFASDAELPGLAERAISEKLKGEAIKKSIKDWRPDNHRA